MKTQIPRVSHQPERHYSGVYEQMGRMMDAADWNELVEILKRRQREALNNAVHSGTPRDGGAAIVQAGPGDVPQIRAGYAYAEGELGLVDSDDGVGVGGILDFERQAAFPDPPSLPADLADVRFYVDIWDRTVLSIEDPELRDPGLHGADTCTRTERMAQVKWCSTDIDPESPTENPNHGDANLRLSLRSRRATPDPCDPCADEIDLNARVGNYLFRLEVHDVQGDAADPTQLTLKWSVENAAEQHPVGEEPADFSADAWVYEFYNRSADSHLGVHHVPGFTPTRGELHESYPAVPPAAMPHVRRWDGYIQLERDGGAWVVSVDGNGDPVGREKASELREAVVPDAPGEFTIGASLELALETMMLELRLEGSTFVAGDYWHGMVREAIHDTGAVILAATPPQGIVHRYLRIADFDAAETLIDPIDSDNPRWRQLHFPPLSNMRATDVGYATQCQSGLFGPEHDTVKKALDQVCSIDAGHVGFTAEPDCERLQDATTVEEALNILCEETAVGGGCKVTVGEDGQFASIREALDELAGRDEVCLCLLPGDHRLEGFLRINPAPRVICISGCGAGSRLRVDDRFEFVDLESVSLKELELNFDRDATMLFANCRRVEIRSCTMRGVDIDQEALIQVTRSEELVMTDNRISAASPLGREAPPILHLMDALQRGTFTDNVFDGLITMHEGDHGKSRPSETTLTRLLRQLREGNVNINEPRGRLNFSRNTIRCLGFGGRMVSDMENVTAAGGGNLNGLPEEIQLHENLFLETGNRVVAVHVNVSANTFQPDDNERDMASIFGETGVFLSNVGGNGDNDLLHSFLSNGPRPGIQLVNDFNYARVLVH